MGGSGKDVNNDDKMDIDNGAVFEQQSLTQQIVINDYSVPFSKFDIAAGSLITIKGGPVLLMSDKPLECMSLTFDKDGTTTYNYFSCKTCNSNCNIFNSLMLILILGICENCN